MPRSEIDDIFAASAPPPKKKIKTSPPTKSHHPETILDPSKKQPSQKIKRRREKKHPKADDDRFKDSRGSTPRRKTADGYNIYKEDELGISTTGGGDHPIPSLPLSSDFHFVQTPLFVRSIANAVSDYATRSKCIQALVSITSSVQPSLSTFIFKINSCDDAFPLSRLYRSLADPALVAVVCKVNM